MAPSHVGYAPTLEKFLKSLKGQPLEASIENLVSLLKRRQITGSEQCAIATAHILLQVVAKSKWADVDALLERVQQTGRKLVDARPQELVLSNVVRRVLRLIRDEAEEDRNGNGEFGVDSVSDLQALSPNDDDASTTISRASSFRPSALSATSSYLVPQSMFNLLSASPLVDSASTGSPFGRDSGVSTPVSHAQPASMHALRSEVIDGIDEIKDEIASADDQIATFAEIQIHPSDFVLVYKPSPTVERFLVRAAAKRKFTVLLAGVEAPRAGRAGEAPYGALRKKLASAGVKTIILLNSGIMAFMPRVNKVILGARAVVANGGVIAEGGAGLVARAAHEYHKSVVVLSGVYKLCPEDPFDLEGLVEYGDPSGFVSFSDGPMVGGVEVESTVTEFIQPELVDVYISNLGPHSRDHLQGIINDHYKKEDIDFLMQ